MDVFLTYMLMLWTLSCKSSIYLWRVTCCLRACFLSNHNLEEGLHFWLFLFWLCLHCCLHRNLQGEELICFSKK